MADQPLRVAAAPPRSYVFDGLSVTAWCLAVAAAVETALLLLTTIGVELIALLHAGVFSVVTFALFGFDKWRARRSGRRVSEANLLGLSIVGGAAGGLAATLAFRHKNRKLGFKATLILALMAHITLIGWLFVSQS